MFRVTKILVCISLLCLGTTLANATVIYDFTAYNDPVGSFTFISNSFITTATSVAPGDLASMSPASPYSVSFVPNVYPDLPVAENGDYIGFPSGDFIYKYMFNLGAFTAYGDYYTLPGIIGNHDGELKVSAGGSETAPVPEPSTILLLGAGLIGAAFLRKRMTSR